MKKTLQDQGFDNLDRAILEELQFNGRVSVADLARKIHLSQPAVHNRIKRLEKSGVIAQYVAVLSREHVGYDVLCFVEVSVQQEHLDNLRKAISAMPEVLECYRMSGRCDLMLKVVVENHRRLNAFIDDNLSRLQGVERVETAIVMSEIKSTTAVGLE